ncbi:MAG TPA: hypothetical protein H9815_16145 [Candidatus Ruania gallistercoris]|uniref:PH domain-containing protein n=1 Tax=Candidatus Ruania gallistercoris TaxID=2838746 RepID=A0A9D2EH03_9MICO|nr:hypothetical protein [Candidatus Ruania gallistercoris]
MTDGAIPPPSPYDPGAPLTPPPATHQVVVKATRGTIFGQTIFGVLLLLLGCAALAVAIVQPPPEGRVVVLVVGGVFSLLGLLVCLTLKRTLRSQTYTFTRAGLEGTAAVGGRFRLPWAALDSVTIETWEKLGFWETLLHRRLHLARFSYLLLALRPGADLSGVPAAWTTWKVVRLPFWNRPELVHALAYGCRTFAGATFQGVSVR